MPYYELQITSNFSFLQGASHPEELVEEAALLGYTAIAITDRNSLAGIVRAHAAARKQGIRLLPACRIDIQDGCSLLAYPKNLAGYSWLCNLLSTGNLRAEKGSCLLYKKDVLDCAGDIKWIAVAPPVADDYNWDDQTISCLHEYATAFAGDICLAATKHYQGEDQKNLFALHELSKLTGIPLIATNDVYYHHASRRPLQDVLTCIREKCTIHNAGYRLHANAERFLKSPQEMSRLFMQYPAAIRNTEELVAACNFSLDELVYEYPEEITTKGRTPQEELTCLAWKGAEEIFGLPLPEKTKKAIEHELSFIQKMNYASYFLTVYDIVRYARSQGILCQGRGSAANSTVCFCLGITSVNPEKFDLLFERFISDARNEPPDIDVDFEHERREEVIQYIYNKYGRDRAAIVATVTTMHQKGAIRDVAKAMGLSLDTVNKLSASIWEFTDEWFDAKRLQEHGFDPRDKQLLLVLKLTAAYMGFPRQLGQHTGGFVITREKLSGLCPILNARMENRTCIEWNKDDIDALGFMKVDVLGLGMLTCIRKAFELARQHYGLNLTLASIPQDDPVVYDMICRADTIGVFQIESRAQQSMLPRLKPRCFYDLVIEVAIVRPGPIQGDMVHPYLRRRNGEEPVEYPSKELEEILKRTLGVPLFQEQAMKIAIVAAGFSPAEADELRRSMATFKLKGLVSKFEEKLVKGMMSRGYEMDYAKKVFRQLEGFGSYGFPESHAASFALLVYVSCWLKCYYPDVFACALLNSMPMGFYQPAQIVGDAIKHGVVVKPVDVNFSLWDNTLEEPDGSYKVLRLGFRQVKGMRAEDAATLIAGRCKAFQTIDDLRNAGLTTAALEKLAEADAFRSMGLDRRQALWEVSTKDTPENIFAGTAAPDQEQEAVLLPEMSLPEHVVHDYASTSLSLKAHPVAFVRTRLTAKKIISTRDLAYLRNGQPVKIAGLVLVRQRPGTAGGVCFMTIEDEWGFANLVIFQSVFEKYHREVLHSKLIMVAGKVQVEGAVIHVIVQDCHDYSFMLRKLRATPGEAGPTLAFVDPPHPAMRPCQKSATSDDQKFPQARNFK